MIFKLLVCFKKCELISWLECYSIEWDEGLKLKLGPEKVWLSYNREVYNWWTFLVLIDYKILSTQRYAIFKSSYQYSFSTVMSFISYIFKTCISYLSFCYCGWDTDIFIHMTEKSESFYLLIFTQKKLN